MKVKLKFSMKCFFYTKVATDTFNYAFLSIVNFKKKNMVYGYQDRMIFKVLVSVTEQKKWFPSF